MRIFRILKEIWSLSFKQKIAWIRGLVHSNSCGKKNRYSLKSAQKAKEKWKQNIKRSSMFILASVVANIILVEVFMRQTKYEIIKERYDKGLVETKSFSVLIDNFHTDINVGLLIRTAAALGAREIFIVGQKEWQRNVACAADKFISISHCEDNDSMYQLIKNYDIVCLEQTDAASFLPFNKYPVNPIFVLGNETTGVSPFWLEKAREIVQIKMFGGPKSLNVNVAAGILFMDFINNLNLSANIK